MNYQNLSNTAYFKIKLIAKKEPCSAYGFTSPIIKNYIEKRINHNVYMINNETGEVEINPKHIRNAIIENRNKIIKAIKHNANGYTNWECFRKRVHYVLKPN